MMSVKLSRGHVELLLELVEEEIDVYKEDKSGKTQKYQEFLAQIFAALEAALLE